MAVVYTWSVWRVWGRAKIYYTNYLDNEIQMLVQLVCWKINYAKYICKFHNVIQWVRKNVIQFGTLVLQKLGAFNCALIYNFHFPERGNIVAHGLIAVMQLWIMMPPSWVSYFVKDLATHHRHGGSLSIFICMKEFIWSWSRCSQVAEL